MKENQIETACPECGSRYVIDRQSSGLNYICPQCGFKIPLYKRFIDVNGSNYDKITASNRGILLIIFIADWSQPSKNFDIPMKKLSNQYYNRINIAVYDIADSEEHAKEMKIFSIPTIIIYKDQDQKIRLEGFYTAEELSAYVEKYL